MTLVHVLAIGIAVLAVVAIRRGHDVRFVLFTAGLVLVSIMQKPWMVFDTFQVYLGKDSIIGPICTAMGYAFVLKATECDAHMVRLLVRPLRKVRSILVPGGVAIGFMTNMAITSQTASAAAVGPILLPLLLAAGIRPAISVAVVLIGCSIGGNLFNPGEPDIVAINAATGVDVPTIISSAVVPNLLSLAAATVVLWIMSIKGATQDVSVTEDGPVDLVRALLPPLPVILLLVLQPGLNLVPAVFDVYPKGLPISLVMLVCTGLVLILLRENIDTITKAFFAGMGHAFTHVISLIIAAGCFIAGLEATGLIEAAAAVFVEQAALAGVVSPLLTWILAWVSGSGTAPSVSFSKAFLPSLSGVDLGRAVDLGIFGAIGASIGRTMSPVAAVVLFTADLGKVSVKDVIRTVSLPLLIALAVTIAYSLFSAS
mgnify:CR=1 FL=1